MDQQKFKDLVKYGIDKLEQQGEPSIEYHTNSCRYLSHSGKCCIVGHMMPNDQVRKDADRGTGYGVSGVKSLFKENSLPWLSQFTEEQIDTLFTLQGYHDSSSLNSEVFQTTITKMRDLHSKL